MFGYGFQYEKPAEQLANGLYNAYIKKTEVLKYPSGDEYVLVSLMIKDHPDCQPNSISISDRPVEGRTKANGQPITAQDCKNWDKSMSRFFDAFGIVSHSFFVNEWVGHKGVVKCVEQYDKNEPDKKSKKYKEFYPVVQNNADTTTQPVQQAPQTQAPVQQQIPEDVW